MKFCTGLFITFISGLCFITQAQTLHHLQKHDEKWALAKINALPEVQTFLRIADKRELPDVIIDCIPNADNGWECRVKVGYSKDMFRSILIFDVNIKNSVIYYEDWADTKAPRNITLGTWRRWKNDPPFNKVHTFNKSGVLIAL